MKTFGVLFCMVWAVVQLSQATAPTAGATEGAAVKQSFEEALAQDLSLVAKGQGWTVAQAAAQYRAAEVIGKIAEQVSEARPESFVGSALSAQPGGAPTLYVKGPADKFVRDLVDSSEISIVLADNQPFSFDELEARQQRAHRALQAMGFREVVSGVNITGAGRIPATVRVEPDVRLRREEVLSALPADLRASVDLTMSDASIVTDMTSFGGMRVQQNGVNNYCTSGWSVRKTSTGVTGVTTAGHCESMNGIVHPGHGTHTFIFQAEHRGGWGDIQWHTTNYAEVDDFYADEFGNIRDVQAVEPRANISLNEPVCVYGRVSNQRDCGLVVADVSISCTDPDEPQFPNDNLVQMNGKSGLEFGDSGGGWSFNFTAFGSSKGVCGNRDAWSVADLYDDALGVTVLTN